MSRASAAANGLMLAVAQVCGLFDVPSFRMQSRVFTVVGAGGRERPMCMGEWTDATGQKRRAGMADWLLTPRIRLDLPRIPSPYCDPPHFITVPLWVECKVGDGRQTRDQKDFQGYVENAGAFYLLLRDPDTLVEWFRTHGVEKR